ncbi:hypothetical protein R6Q59_020588 [Mikania micrantha]
MTFELKSTNSIDSHVMLLNGRQLQYQNENNNDEEDGFVTIVRFSEDNTTGRATGLINWKMLAVEFLPEEDAAFLLLVSMSILRSVTEMRKEDVGSLLIRRRLKEARLGDRDWGSVVAVEPLLKPVYVKPWFWNPTAVMARHETDYVTKSYSVEECGDELYKQALFG